MLQFYIHFVNYILWNTYLREQEIFRSASIFVKDFDTKPSYKYFYIFSVLIFTSKRQTSFKTWQIEEARATNNNDTFQTFNIVRITYIADNISLLKR